MPTRHVLGCRRVSSLWLVLLCSLELGLELLERQVLVTDVSGASAGDREATPEQQHPAGDRSDQPTGKAERLPICSSIIRRGFTAWAPAGCTSCAQP